MTQVAPTARASDPLLGRVLDNRYRIEALVARGGMATVYRGADTRLDRTVAIKVMHPSFAADPGFVERFEREARAAARLTCPQVVALHDQGTDDGLTYLVMEYVPGRTVRDLLRATGPLRAEQALAILEPVAVALAAAHRAGYVHRDIKPENVLIGDDGSVKVTDFGLARAIEAADSSRTHGLLLGTVAYLSPEQVEQEHIDARSDVYSAGILLFELVTGQVPFAAAAPMQVAYRHVHEDVPSPLSLRPDLAPEVATLVARATRRDPAGRFDSAKSLLREIQRVRATLPPPNPWGPLPTDTLVVAHPGAGFDVAPQLPADPPTRQVLLSATDPMPPAAGPVWLPRGSSPDTNSASPGPDAEGQDWSGTAPDTPSPGHPRRSRRSRWIGLVALVCIGGLLAFLFGPLQRVSVPRVIGKSAKEATALLAAANLKLDTAARAYSETVAKGKVISTDPGAGRSARTGTTVVAVISRGPERYDVPEVIGTTVKQATVALEAVKLVKGETEDVYHDDVAKGRIISTEPDVGESVKPGTAVTLTVSRGPKPVALPTLTGTDGEAAKAKLKELGLYVKSSSEYSETVAKGLVISMTPTDGTTVDHGSTIKLLVSKGPPLVKVPSVVGKSEQEAVDLLTAAGFQVRKDYPLLVGVLDRVQGQEPAGGSTAPKGSTVTIDLV
ncbi:MAG: Stk1 family PASTA domain-containing Ser/Thr kinase [Candidatus Nanopelagicales bacterium]